MVATPREICERYIRDDDIHANVLEYYHGNHRCSLFFDIEWVNPKKISLSEHLNSIGHFIDILIKFISISTVCDDGVAFITRDDVCVEQACSNDGRKASFHVKIPTLVFRNIACDMRSFVFYFCMWMYENQSDITKTVPEIFFC